MKKETLRQLCQCLLFVGMLLFQGFIWKPRNSLIHQGNTAIIIWNMVVIILYWVLYIYLRKRVNRYFKQDMTYIQKDLLQRSCRSAVTGIMFFIYFGIWRPSEKIFFVEDIKVVLPQLILVIIFWSAYILLENAIDRYFTQK